MLRHRANFVIIVFIWMTLHATGQKIEINIRKDAVYFLEGSDSILKYQIEGKSFQENLTRSNYIHPLYALDGQVLTEDFPKDHPHHRGIFWAWHQLYAGDERLGDGWDINNFRWEVTSVKELKGREGTGSIEAEVLWKTRALKDTVGPFRSVLKENTVIRAYAAREGYRQIDIEISLRALEPNIRIGGSEDVKGYGGFSSRIRLDKDMVFTSTKGRVTPDNLPIRAGTWMDISGSLGKGASTSGISILCHPDNPGNKDRWILRSEESMQNAVYPYPGAQPVEISEKRLTILRYRLLIHQGDADDIDIDAIYDTFRKI